MKLLGKQKKKVDFLLFLAVLILTLVGLFFVFESSSVVALRNFSDSYHFLKDQTLWFIIGFCLLIFFSFFDYHKFYNLSLFLILINILLLLVVFIPGVGIKILGAHRWISIGEFIIQPAEIAKLSLIIYLSSWFSAKEKNRLLPFLLIVFMVTGLIVLEPDLGTGIIIILISLCLYFLSEAPVWHSAVLVPILGFLGLGLSIFSPYRFRRILTFLDPKSDPLGASYHIRQVILALGSGGFLGVGLGKSRQKFEYLPEATTDSIFAIIGEELGFIGGIIIIGIILFIIWRGARISLLASDRFGKLLGFGLTSFLAIQSIINLGAMVAIIPLTGVPLPFISYGGSNLIVSLSAIGILLNISKQGVAVRK